MLGIASELQLPVGHAITGVNDPHSAADCVVSAFEYCVLCFHIPSFLQNGNAHLCYLLLVRKEEGNNS